MPEDQDGREPPSQGRRRSSVRPRRSLPAVADPDSRRGFPMAPIRNPANSETVTFDEDCLAEVDRASDQSGDAHCEPASVEDLGPDRAAGTQLVVRRASTVRLLSASGRRRRSDSGRLSCCGQAQCRNAGTAHTTITAPANSHDRHARRYAARCRRPADGQVNADQAPRTMRIAAIWNMTVIRRPVEVEMSPKPTVVSVCHGEVQRGRVVQRRREGLRVAVEAKVAARELLDQW